MSETAAILSAVTKISVDVKEDHLRGLVHAEPLAGLSELVWNALDAEAKTVTVKLLQNSLGSLDEIIVEDDGHGMTYGDALAAFGSLGGSWKLNTTRSRSGTRHLHGQDGKGRWRAFSLGDRVEWESVAEAPGGERERIRLSGGADNLHEYELSDPVATGDETGTTVKITVGAKTPDKLLADQAADDLSARFALYLEQYPVVKIVFRGLRLDPSGSQTYRADYDLSVPAEPPDATLTVIEWNSSVDRKLYLCDPDGMALDETEVRIQAPGFDFTSYLRWAGFSDLRHDIGIVDLGHPVLLPVVEAARDQLRTHFKERQAQRTREIVEDWKKEQVYPYTGEPATGLERAERSLFEVVAISAAPAVNGGEDRASKRLSLRLIREALEQDPGSLHRVLTEVLELPQDRLDELESLLEHTTLAAIISAAKAITERLDFLNGLEVLLFDPQSKKQLKERTQLHRILENETWVFGEEYALTASDKSLSTVLKKHVDLLGRKNLAEDTQVTDEDGNRLIVDLMLARSMEQVRDRREHLIVELKRPSVKIGPDELTQIQKYAFAVVGDERFTATDVFWDFVIVSNELTEYAKQSSSQANREPGLFWEADNRAARIWVWSWGQVIEQARHRLKFVQQSLDYEGTEEQALARLREVHGKYLPPVLTALAAERA